MLVTTISTPSQSTISAHETAHMPTFAAAKKRSKSRNVLSRHPRLADKKALKAIRHEQDLPEISTIAITPTRDPQLALFDGLYWIPDQVAANQKPENRAQKTDEFTVRHNPLQAHLPISTATIIGGRSQQEDTLGVFRLPKKRPKQWQNRFQQAFQKLQAETRQHLATGATLVAGILNPDKKLTLGWLGDSRAYWVNANPLSNRCSIEALTQDHNVAFPGEKDRVLARGGIFDSDNRLESRIPHKQKRYWDPDLQQHMLMTIPQKQFIMPLTRSFGDNGYPGLIRQGGFVITDLKKRLQKGAQGFVVLVSDGCLPSHANDKTPKAHLVWPELFLQGAEALRAGQQPHIAAWLTAWSQMNGQSDNSSAIVIPVSRGKSSAQTIGFALSDGHGGDAVSKHLLRRLPVLLSS